MNIALYHIIPRKMSKSEIRNFQYIVINNILNYPFLHDLYMHILLPSIMENQYINVS